MARVCQISQPAQQSRRGGGAQVREFLALNGGGDVDVRLPRLRMEGIAAIAFDTAENELRKGPKPDV